MRSVVKDPFDVLLGDLRDHRGARHVLRRGTLLEALVADVDSRVPAGAEAVAEVDLEAFDGGASVVGKGRSPWEGECRRCLASVDGELVVPVRELFRRGGGDEEGTYPMSEEQLNLRELVLDALFSALPLMPLCRPGCAGICPHCGADRNVGDCGCQETDLDPRWAGLEVLRGELVGTEEPAGTGEAGDARA